MLYAQQQPDSLLIKQIPTIQNQITEQQDEISQLNLKVDEIQNDSLLLRKFESVQLNLEKLQEQIQQLSSELGSLKNLTNQQRLALRNSDKKYDSLLTRAESQKGLIESNTTNINAIASDLGTQIQETGQKANTQIAQLDSSLEKNRLYWIIATLVTLLLGGLVYWLLGKRIKSSKTDVETQIRNTKASLEEESVVINTKLIEVLDKQLKLQELKQAETPKDEEKDHSLVLKVADEATKILMSLEVMDKNIKGYKFLKKYASTILNNVNAYGYEIPPLIGQKYNSAMEMEAKMEFDDSIEEGKQIIKRIIKPQINYNGKMIQAAKVIVAFNE